MEQSAAEGSAPPSAAIRVIKAAFLAVVAVGLAAMAVAMMSVAVSENEPPSVGVDDHQPLRAGAQAAVRTEAGLNVVVLIRSVAGGGTAPEITATVRGAEDQASQPGRWTFGLDDGSHAEGAATFEKGEVRVQLAGPLPAGRKPKLLHFDPDSSRGDMYFEFQ